MILLFQDNSAVGIFLAGNFFFLFPFYGTALGPVPSTQIGLALSIPSTWFPVVFTYFIFVLLVFLCDFFLVHSSFLLSESSAMHFTCVLLKVLFLDTQHSLPYWRATVLHSCVLHSSVLQRSTVRSAHNLKSFQFFGQCLCRSHGLVWQPDAVAYTMAVKRDCAELSRYSCT